MAITVEIPPPLREHAGGLLRVDVDGATVGVALADLVRQHPAMQAKLYQDGKLRAHVNVLVDDEDIRYLDETDTPVKDGQTIALVPAVAGG